MKRTRLIVFVGVLGLITLLSGVSAHVPVTPGENENLASAAFIEDPLKSWAVYGELQEETQYYRFIMEAGEPIYLGLLVPPFEAARSFTPSLVLMGPGLEGTGLPPEGIELPSGYGIMVLDGQLASEATYEPFGPGSFYWIGEIRMSAPSTGMYYVAIVPPGEGGNYGLVIGTRESFTLQEWILNPFNVITVYQWEGQDLLLILTPAAIIGSLALGASVYLLRRRQRLRYPFAWLTSVAGALYLGSSAVVLAQIAWSLTRAPVGGEVTISLLLAFLPLVLGLGILRLGWKAEGGPKVKGRLKLAILATAGLFAWAGFIIGPAVALSASLSPTRRKVPTSAPQAQENADA